MLQGAWEAMEIAAGAGAAALGATFAEVARRQGLLAFAPQPRWLRRVPRVVRRVRSEWAATRLPGGRPAPVAAGNRAVLLAAENMAPNTMAVQSEDRAEALKHDLVPGRGTAALPS